MTAILAVQKIRDDFLTTCDHISIHTPWILFLSMDPDSWLLGLSVFLNIFSDKSRRRYEFKFHQNRPLFSALPRWLSFRPAANKGMYTEVTSQLLGCMQVVGWGREGYKYWLHAVYQSVGIVCISRYSTHTCAPV